MPMTPNDLLSLTLPSAEYWAPISGPMIEAHLRRMKQAAEQTRLWETANRIQLLEEDWKDLILKKVYEQYTTERVRQMAASVISSEHNVFKRICSELSTTYKYGVTRELEDEGAERIARQLWDEVRIDERLEKANFLLNGLRDLLIAPIVVDGKMQLWLITPDRTVVVQHPDDPTQCIAMWTERVMQNTPGYVTIQRVYADAEKWIIGSTRNTHAKVIKHNLGRVPFVVAHATERVDSFWLATEGQDLYDATIGVAMDLFRLARITQYQSELQPFFKGSPRKLAKGMALGGESIWAADGDFGVLPLQGDVEKMLSVIKTRIGMIAESYGLPADLYDLSGSSAASGFQARMKRLPLMEARAKQVKTWRRVERELLQLMAMVSMGSHPTLKLDPLRADFKTIKFHDEPGLVEPLTQNRIWRERIDLGLMSPVDAMMAANPELTRVEAKKKVMDVMNENSELWSEMAKRNMPSSGPVGALGSAKTPTQNGADGGKQKQLNSGDQSDTGELTQDPGTAPAKPVGNKDFSSGSGGEG